MTRWSRFLLTLAFSAALALASAAHADVLAHWSFDELTGQDHDTFADSSGNPTKHNALVADKGQIAINVAADVPFGKAVSFTGKTGSYLDLPQLNIYDKSFTIAVWVYLSKADHNYVLADWTTGLGQAYAFGFDFPKGKTDADRITAWMKTDSQRTNKKKNNEKYYADAIRFTPAANMPLNSWHHVAWVWDRQDKQAASLSIYLDGAKVEGVGLLKGSQATLLNTHRGPKIGFKQDAESTFHGSMDELWVFDQALTAAEVTNLMKSNDIAGAATFVAATPATGPAVAAATPTPPSPGSSETPSHAAAPDAATPAAVPAATAAAENPAPATPSTPAPTPAAAAPASETPAAAPQTPVFTTAAPRTAPAPVAAAPAHVPAKPAASNELKPDFMSTARNAAATPLPSPTINTVAVTPHRYTPERLLGLVGSGAVALTLSSFLVWATMERSRMHRPRMR